jgi:hypothetical protein
MNANGPAVEGVNVGGAVRRYESRLRPPKRFSHEGGCRKVDPAGKPSWCNFCFDRRSFNVGGQMPANDKVVSVAGFVQSRRSQIWQMRERLFVTIKLSR